MPKNPYRIDDSYLFSCYNCYADDVWEDYCNYVQSNSEGTYGSDLDSYYEIYDSYEGKEPLLWRIDVRC